MSGFLESIKSGFNTAVSKVRDTISPAAEPVNTALPSVATDSGSQKMLGTAPEAPGTTVTGGRRRKTRRGGRRRKTHRRHRKH